MEPKEVNLAALKKRASEGAVKEGAKLYRTGRVVTAVMRGEIVTAVVADGRSAHTLEMWAGDAQGGAFCTCPDLRSENWLCRHAVALAIHVATHADDMLVAAGKLRAEIDGLLAASTDEQIRRFVAAEMKASPALLERFATGAIDGPPGRGRDYRTKVANMIKAAAKTRRTDEYGQDGEYAGGSNLEHIYKAAEQSSGAGDHTEAARIYAHILDAFVSHRSMVTWREDYADTVSHCMLSMAREVRLAEGAAKPQWRRQMITFAFGRWLDDESDMRDECETAMFRMCGGDGASLRHLLDLIGRQSGGAGAEDGGEYNPHPPYHTYGKRALDSLRAEVSGRLGIDGADLGAHLEARRGDGTGRWARYVEYLGKSDPQAAEASVREGIGKCAGMALYDAAISIYKKGDRRGAELIKDLFVERRSWHFYDALKETSQDWKADVESLMAKLGAVPQHPGMISQERYAIREILRREGRYAELLEQVLGGSEDDGDLGTRLDAEFNLLAPKFPAEYFDAYYGEVERLAPRARTRDDYVSVVINLRRMAGIPDVPDGKARLGELVDRIREKYAAKRSSFRRLLKSIKPIVPDPSSDDYEDG